MTPEHITLTLTILGTLAGTTLGIIGSWLVQKRQLEHADATRFHERRLTAYSEFIWTAAWLFSHGGSGETPSQEDLMAFLRAFEIVRLIATDPVVIASGRLHADVACLMLGSVSAPDYQQLRQTFNKDVGDLIAAVRKEMGTAGPPAKEVQTLP